MTSLWKAKDTFEFTVLRVRCVNLWQSNSNQASNRMELASAVIVIGCAVVISIFILCCRNSECCQDAEPETNIVPTQHRFQNGSHSLPTSMPLPPSEYRNCISLSAPYPPEDPPYPLEPQPLASRYTMRMPQPYSDEPPTILRMPHPSHYHLHPVTTIASYSPEVYSRSTPPYHRTRSYSIEDPPPSYAEAVRLEQQTGAPQRHHTSGTNVRDHA